MKKSEPILTVVTTTYNHEKYIEHCIKSVISQRVNYKYKFLISDDNSQDKTREIISKYQKKYPDIIDLIVREKNLGAMGNFVETLNSVHTKYVALLDGDDYWTDNNKLQTMIDFLEKHEDYSMCFHQTRIFFENNTQDDMLYPTNIKEDLTIDDLLKENLIPANTVTYRWKYLEKDSLKKEFPDNIVPGDYFIHLMHASMGKIHFFNKKMSEYRRQESGMWWLSSQLDRQDEFYDIYGERYLNFFENVESKLNLDFKTFNEQKRWIISKSVVAYVRLKRNRKFHDLYKKYYDKYQDVFFIASQTLSLKERLYFYMHCNPSTLFKKIAYYFNKKVISRLRGHNK